MGAIVQFELSANRIEICPQRVAGKNSRLNFAAVFPIVFEMKLGLGLYRHQLNAEHYRFARQCGCTHLVVHLVDYFRSSRSNHPGDQPVGDDAGWGLAGDPDRLWTFEELAAIKKEINAARPRTGGG